jgi:hypothetical protein
MQQLRFEIAKLRGIVLRSMCYQPSSLCVLFRRLT